MPNGVCPFATPISGGIDKAPNLGPMRDIVGICDHAADGWYTTLMDPSYWTDHEMSVNFAISRAGEIGQILNLFTGPFGQGWDQTSHSITPQSPGISWPGWPSMNRANPNAYLVAVEHEDWARNAAGVGAKVTGSEWTPAQFDADLRLKRWILEETMRVKGKNLLRFGKDSLAGHHMFDPVNRSDCPGKFWKEKYRDELYAQLSQEDDVFNVLAQGKLMGEKPPANTIFDLRRLGFPANAKRVRLQVWPKDKVVEWYHGLDDANNRDAGRTYAPYGIVEVIPAADGHCFVMGGDFDVSPLGWYS